MVEPAPGSVGVMTRTITADLEGQPVKVTFDFGDDLDTEWVLYSGGEVIVAVPELGMRLAVTGDSVRRLPDEVGGNQNDQDPSFGLPE